MPAAVVFPMLSHFPTNQTFFRPWVDSKQTNMGYFPSAYQQRPQRANLPRPSRPTSLDGALSRRPLNVPHTERQIPNASYQNRQNCNSSNHDRQINGSFPERQIQPYPPYRGREADWTNNIGINTCQPPPSNSSQSSNYTLNGQPSGLQTQSPYATSQQLCNFQDYPHSFLYVPLYQQFPTSQIQEIPKSRNSIVIRDPKTNEVVTEKLLNEARSNRKEPQSQNSVAAEFATQVATLAIESNSESSKSNFSINTNNTAAKNEAARKAFARNESKDADEIKAEFARKVAALAEFSCAKKQHSAVNGTNKPTLNSSSGYATPVLPTQVPLDQAVDHSLDGCIPQYSSLHPTTQYYTTPADPQYIAISHAPPIGAVYYQPSLVPALVPTHQPILTGAPIKETKAVKIQNPNTLEVLNANIVSKPTGTLPKHSETKLEHTSISVADSVLHSINEIPEQTSNNRQSPQERETQNVAVVSLPSSLESNKIVAPIHNITLETNDLKIVDKNLQEEDKANVSEITSNLNSLQPSKVNTNLIVPDNDSKVSDTKFRTVGVQCSPGLQLPNSELNPLGISKIPLLVDSSVSVNEDLCADSSELKSSNDMQDESNLNKTIQSLNEDYIKENCLEDQTVHKTKEVEDYLEVSLNKDSQPETISTLLEECLEQNNSDALSEKSSDAKDPFKSEEKTGISNETKDSFPTDTKAESQKLPLLDDIPPLTLNHKSDSIKHDLTKTEVKKTKAKKDVTNSENKQDVKLAKSKQTLLHENQPLEVPGESEIIQKNSEIKQTQENEKEQSPELDNLTSTVKQNATPETSTLSERIHSLIKHADVDFTPSYMVGRLEVKEIKDKSAESSPTVEGHIKNAEKIDFTNTLQTEKKTLKYEENQWSPLNRSGKKFYSREFLLKLKDHPCALCPPPALPILDFISDYISRSSSQGIYNNRQYPNRYGPRTSEVKQRKIISTSLTQQISLHKSQDAWKPHKELNDNEEEEESKEKELCKKVRGILNKLTPENFDKLVSQLRDLEIDSDKKLKLAIDLVFEKAIDEPGFSVQYAKLCQKLAGLQASPGQKSITFKKLLLTKCQFEFERDKTDELKREEKVKEIKTAETDLIKKQLRENLEEEERKSRRRSLGNIRFIGELFKLDILTEFIMHECIKNLLQKKDNESLECLCRLLTTVGMKLESKDVKSKKTSKTKPAMDGYFREMKRIVDKKNTTSRVRFMLQDVLELKHRKWVPRRDESNPKTIEEIHKEVAQEEKEQQVLIQVTVPRRNIEPDRVNRNKQNFIQNSGWTSVGKSKGRFVTVDRKKLEQVSKCEEIKLQPVKEFTNWGSGCSGGSNRQMNDGPLNKQIAMKNRFDALTQNEASNQEISKLPPTPDATDGNVTDTSAVVNVEIPLQINDNELVETVQQHTNPIETKLEDYRIIEEINDSELYNDSLLLQGPDLSDEEIEKRTKPLIDEFLVNNDFKEAVECIVELASPSTAHYVITTSINQVLERSPQARHLLGQLVCHLIKNNVITLKHYVLGLQAVTELADDYAIDIPMIWTYLGEIIEPTIDITSIQCLKELAQPLLTSGTAGKLLSAVLHAITAKRGASKTYDLWQDSGMLLSDFLNPDESVETLVEEHKLHFITNPKEFQQTVYLAINNVKEELDFLLQRRNITNDEFVEWISVNIGVERMKEAEFIRALVIAVIDSAIQRDDLSCKLQESKLKGRTTVLQQCLDQQQKLELQALYAIQSLMCELKHPPSLLKHIFDVLYSEDLVSEETFKLWQSSDDPAELEGKGVAVNSVQSFFTWLAKADIDISEVAD